MLVQNLEDLGFPRKGRRRRRRHVVGGGYYPYYPYDYGYTEVEVEPTTRYVILDASSKMVAVVAGKVIQVAAGYSFRPMTPGEAAAGMVPTTISGMGEADASMF